MKKTIFVGMIVSLMLLLACNKEKSPTDFDFEEAFTLNFNQELSSQEDPDIRVKFMDLEEDSRCPANANCVWAGRVVVLVEFNEEILRLGLSPEDVSDDPVSSIAMVDEYQIELLSVWPFPALGEEVEKEDYQLELVVRK